MSRLILLGFVMFALVGCSPSTPSSSDIDATSALATYTHSIQIARYSTDGLSVADVGQGYGMRWFVSDEGTSYYGSTEDFLLGLAEPLNLLDEEGLQEFDLDGSEKILF